MRSKCHGTTWATVYFLAAYNWCRRAATASIPAKLAIDASVGGGTWHTIGCAAAGEGRVVAQHCRMPSVEEFLCQLLRRESPCWPQAAGESFAAHFLERARYHGVLPLVYDRLQREPGAGQDWPQQVLHACREDALGHAMWELRHRDFLMRVLAQLAKVGVRPVLFKGTALAYTLYPARALRARGDTDLIISPGARSQASAALEALGFTKQLDTGGEFVFYQASFISPDEGGGQHALDVHWRISNSELLSRLFDYQELFRKACPVPRLGPDALAAGRVDALLLACMHRATHHQAPYYVDGVAYRGGDRLIWLYDIHLLAGGFSQAEWDELIGRAREKGLLAVCRQGIERAQARFHTAIPEEVVAAMRPQGRPEAAAQYLGGGALRQQWMDFVAIAGTANKMRFLADTAFPPAGYLRQKYPLGRSDWLPWLYLRRVSGGLLKRLHRRAGTR